jgi:hypothetical protein
LPLLPNTHYLFIPSFLSHLTLPDDVDALMAEVASPASVEAAREAAVTTTLTNSIDRLLADQRALLGKFDHARSVQ